MSKSESTAAKSLLSRIKSARDQIHGLLQDSSWVEEARKYAEKQGQEAKKVFSEDMQKIKNFLDKERRELELFQKEFIKGQKKEIKKIWSNAKRRST